MTMRRFTLERDVDLSGVSGVGRVAEGVVFSTGTVALTWLTEVTSLVVYARIEDVEHIHGHGGLSRVVFIDDAEREDQRGNTP
jgi:hypothetical protein